MLLYLTFFLLAFNVNAKDINQSLFSNSSLVKYIQSQSQNIFMEKSSSKLYFSNQKVFNSLNNFQQIDIKENFTEFQSIIDKRNDPDFYFLFSTILYFGLFSIEPNIPLSFEYLLKSASMNHSLAQVIQVIMDEDEKTIDGFNKFYSNFDILQNNMNSVTTTTFFYQRLYIANNLFYDYHKNKSTDSNLDKCKNILKTYGIEYSNLHFIPNSRSNSSCYKVYKLFRHHKHREAINLIRSLSDTVCNDEYPYSNKLSVDDPYIVSYYISKYDCDLAVELVRRSLQNHVAISKILHQADELERQQNLLYAFKLYKILSHFGIESAVDGSIRISKILNLNLPISIKKMKRINDQIKTEKCIDDLAASIHFRSDILTSLSYLKHAIKLVPQSVFVAAPFRVLIIVTNFFNSNKSSEGYFSIYDTIRNNIDLSIFCIGTLAFAFLLKLRLDLFFMPS